jgi:methylated-DNA-[protein]-cysteine S-methyltransferase
MTHRLVVDSQFGTFLLEADEEALTGLQLPGTWPEQDRPPGGARRTAPGHLVEAADQLGQYLEGQREDFDVALAKTPPGTDFQRQVWFTLADIPYGETISYAELARRVGRPTAFRAVGQANGANPFPVFLPCHRVIASGGKIGGYGGGLSLKRKLLALEGHPLGATA